VVPDQEASDGQKDVWIRVAALGVGSVVGGFIIITRVGRLRGGKWMMVLPLLLLLR
jgi:hypothetical protein